MQQRNLLNDDGEKALTVDLLAKLRNDTDAQHWTSPKEGVLVTFLKNIPDYEKLKMEFEERSPFESCSYNQGKTGYCWLYATLHCIFSYLGNKPNETCLFAPEYLMFFDKLEKANLFLNQVLETSNLPFEGPTVSYILNRGVTDRGQWVMAENLIKKYGLLPWDEMPRNCTSTKELNAVLNFYLRHEANELRRMMKEGASSEDILEARICTMQRVYDLLAMFYGKPPERFSYADGEPLTPREFYDRKVRFPFSEYVSILPTGITGLDVSCICTEIMLEGNTVEGGKIHFQHVTSDVFYDAVYQQVTNGTPCWIGCDSGKFLFLKQAVYDDTPFDFSSLLGRNYDLKHDEVITTRMAAMTHAMTLHTVKETRIGRWWRAQDSALHLANYGGDCFLSDGWFQKYTFQAIVQKKYILDHLPEPIKVRQLLPWEFWGIR